MWERSYQIKGTKGNNMNTDRDTSPSRENTPLRKRDVEQLLRQAGGSEQLDARGLNLKGINLAYLNLSGALLAEAHLSGADLRETDLTGADPSGAHLNGATLLGRILDQAD